MHILPAPHLPVARSLTRRDWVPAHLVHKARRESVLVEEWGGSGLKYLVTANWTRDHPYYRFERRACVVVAETLRQGVILVAHAGLDVPMDAAFVMQGLSVRLGPSTWRPTGSPVEASITCRDVVHRRGALRSMVADVVFEHRGKQVAAGRGELVVLPASTYDRIRDGARPLDHISCLRRVAAPIVGCDAAEDVLLSAATDGSMSMVLDTRHAYLFDHPADHVPGMAILEAARQAALLHQLGWDSPGGFEARFFRYAELTDAVEVHAAHTGDRAIVAFSQKGHSIAEVTIYGPAGTM